MKYSSELLLLSSKFIQDYPPDTYPELMYKHGRPYACLLIESHDDYFICVPFRSSIGHKNAFSRPEDFYPIRKSKKFSIKNREPAHADSRFVCTLVNCNNLFLIIRTTSFADSVGHHKSAAFAALHQIRSAHLPVRSSLISSSFGRFIFWTNRHRLHLLYAFLRIHTCYIIHIA